MRSPFLLALVISSAAYAVPAPQVYYYNWVFNIPHKEDPSFFSKRLAAFLKAKKLTGACIDLREGVALAGEPSAQPGQGVSLLLSRPLDQKSGMPTMLEIATALCQGVPNCKPTTLVDQTVDRPQAEIEFHAEGPLKGTFTQFNVMQTVPNLGSSCTSGNVKDSMNHASDVKKALVQKMESSTGQAIALDFPVDITPLDGVKIRGNVGKLDFVYPVRAPVAGAPKYADEESQVAPAGHDGIDLPKSSDRYDNPYGN